MSKWALWGSIALAGIVAPIATSWFPWLLGILLVGVGAFNIASDYIPENLQMGKHGLQLYCRDHRCNHSSRRMETFGR
jgi:hypothetical protein